MPFVGTPEWVAMRRLMLECIGDQLRLKFPEQAGALLAEVRQVYELERLRAIHLAIVTANSPEEIRRVYAAPAMPASPAAEGA
jgi:hypothetical protein